MGTEFLQYQLNMRIHYLLRIITNKRHALSHAPAGNLRGEMQRGAWRYYYRPDSEEQHSAYINKKNISFARKLAQKSYDQQILIDAENELAALRAMLAFYETSGVDFTFSKRPPSHQPLIRSLTRDDEIFLKRWKSQEYEGTPFREDETPLYAKDGTRMHSKSEVSIANMIIDKNIPYLYEKPIILVKDQEVHPDFTIYDIARHREIYWEHLGIMDVENYRKIAFKKIYDYGKTGIYPGKNLILTTETEKVHLDIQTAEKQLDAYLFPR